MYVFCPSCSIRLLSSTHWTGKFHPWPSAQHSGGPCFKRISATVSLKLNIHSLNQIAAGYLQGDEHTRLLKPDCPSIWKEQQIQARPQGNVPRRKPVIFFLRHILKHFDIILKMQFYSCLSQSKSELPHSCPHPEHSFILPFCKYWHFCSQQLSQLKITD